MNQQERLRVFKAQTANVRELNASWRHLKRSINFDLVRGDAISVTVHTRALALTYCAWTEALFSKLIHTPYGLTLDEIDQIKRVSRDTGVVTGWRKCASLAFRRVRASRSGHVANAAQEVDRLIMSYIEAPSLLRNKIAHGQVVVALNRNNTDVNADMSADLSQLNVVTLDRHRFACQGLADIVEAVIESPQKGAMRDYWSLTQRITDHLRDTRRYSLADKVSHLQSKAKRTARPKMDAP